MEQPSGGQISLQDSLRWLKHVLPRGTAGEVHMRDRIYVYHQHTAQCDHKSDSTQLGYCRFVRMNRCMSKLPGVITISSGLAGGCDMSREIILCCA